MSTLLIVPTRQRGAKADEFLWAFNSHAHGDVDLLFAIDEDDVQSYVARPGAKYEVNPRMGLNGTLNHVATKYCDVYDYIAFMGDDHRIRTDNWDEKLIGDGEKYLVSYGDDLLQGANLPTAVLIDAEIVRVLGYMSPPELRHLYLDNFWKTLGDRLGTLRYHPEVVIEHMHFAIGKSEPDEIYLEVNAQSMYDSDSAKYEAYVATKLEDDLRKLV